MPKESWRICIFSLGRDDVVQKIRVTKGRPLKGTEKKTRSCKIKEINTDILLPEIVKIKMSY